MLTMVLFAGVIFLGGCTDHTIETPLDDDGQLVRFESDQALIDAFENSHVGSSGIFLESSSNRQFATLSASTDDTADFSTTNVQVAGIDEADIIKTDGKFIYMVSNGNLVIAKAHPNSEIVTSFDIKNFHPQELFIHNDRLLLFGRQTPNSPRHEIAFDDDNMFYPYYSSTTAVKLYDIIDRSDPKLLRTVEIQGDYLTSRKIDSDVYFVVNTYPSYSTHSLTECDEFVPQFSDSLYNEALRPIAPCTDIGFIEPIQAEQFITIASISMTDEERPIVKETIVGSGSNVYASDKALYIAQTSWSGGWIQPLRPFIEGDLEPNSERTMITKFGLDNGKISFVSRGSVPGHILNQFSMDEFDNHFRIATTIGESWSTKEKSKNNVYVLDKDLDIVGSLEDLAPGESIFSVRFMGKRGYIVTFKKVDPLFVIDLAEPSNPHVLGKLKIPGFSDYLHPYDENHIIGIGKDTVEASESLVAERNLDFAWYQGVKIALFDVSDVNNPIELHKEIIGDRGTSSPVLSDHRAFLFDRERNLMVLPVTVAEIQGEKTRDNQYGDVVFQGAYVYDLTVKNGFQLRGKVTHIDESDVYDKAGFYFYNDGAIMRSLYIGDVLYTLSNARLQLNDLASLDRIKSLVFEKDEYPEPPIMVY